MEFKQGRTVAQILQITGEEADTVRKRWKRNVQDTGGRAFGDAGGQDAVPDEKEFLAMWGKKVERAKQMSVATPSSVRLPELPRQQAAKPKQRFKWPKFSVSLFDVVIWAEMCLGCYSLTNLAKIPGALACIVVFAFFENARRTMRQEPKSTEALPGTPEHETVCNYNSALNRSKTFAFLTVAFIAITFMVCNYKTFYRALSVESDFQIDFYGLELAKVASCWLAVLMSGIAYLSLRGISLSKNLSALK